MLFRSPEFDYWELFDLQKDPREMRSVYGTPQYSTTTKELKTELERLRDDLKVPSPDPPETYFRPLGAKKKQ